MYTLFKLNPNKISGITSMIADFTNLLQEDYFLIADGAVLIHVGQLQLLRKRLHELKVAMSMAADKKLMVIFFIGTFNRLA